MKKLITGLLCLSATLAWARAGTKEEIIRLQSDVLQLQNQIRILQKSFDDQSGVLRSLLEQLNDQVAKTTLTMETLSEALRTQKADSTSAVNGLRQEIQSLSIKLDDTNNRIAAVHRKLEENQLQFNTIRTVPMAAAGGSVEPDRVYAASYNDYLMGNYDLAIAGFKDFLANYPESEYHDNAAYYLGDSYYRQGRFDLAVEALDQAINLYPKGDKTPVAFYKKGMALVQLQRMKEALDTFRILIKLFPDSPEATLAQDELSRLGGS